MIISSDSFKQSINKSLPQSTYGKAFLLITILESTIDIILEAALIARLDLIHSFKLSLDSDLSRTPLAVYLGIFILAHLFQLYFALDALRHKNTIQLIGLCCFNFAFLVYAIIQVPEIREIEYAHGVGSSASTPAILLLIIPACIAICQVTFVYLTWHLFKEFGWQIYKQIGADRKIKRIYLMYQIFMCLLKFDYFFFISFTVQLVLLVPSVSIIEKVLTVIALPSTLLLLVLGYYGVKNELKSVTVAFMIGLLSGSSYFIYKLFRIWKGRHNPFSYQSVFKSLTVFSISCLLMTLLSFTSAMICLKNFGQGLKEQMNQNGMMNNGGQRRKPGGLNYRFGGKGGADAGRTYHPSGSGSSLGTMFSTLKGGGSGGSRKSGSVIGLGGENQTADPFEPLEFSPLDKDPGGGYFLTNLELSKHQLPPLAIDDKNSSKSTFCQTNGRNTSNAQNDYLPDFTHKRMSID